MGTREPQKIMIWNSHFKLFSLVVLWVRSLYSAVVDIYTVPETATLSLMVIGGLVWIRRRCR